MLLEGVRTLDSFNPSGKKVLLRVDINSPVDRKTGRIESDTKINAATLTLNQLLRRGASAVLLAHQGRPGDYDFISLRQHWNILRKRVEGEIDFVPDTCGEEAVDRISGLRPGQALLLENVRYLDYEQKKGTAEEHARTELVTRLSPLFDYFVNDAFAAVHRAHCSMVGFTGRLPSAAGRLMESELSHLSPLLDRPERPVVYLFGGRKFADFLPVLRAVAAREDVDHILLSGYLAISFLMASGTKADDATGEEIRKEADDAFFEEARKLISGGGKIALPVDMGFSVSGRRADMEVSGWPAGARALDIGPSTIEHFSEVIAGARTVFISGPPGVYEKEEFSSGTRRLFEAACGSGIYSVIGGGHTSSAARQLGFEGKVSYVSTGGGALEALITGKELPVLKYLKESGRKFSGSFT